MYAVVHDGLVHARFPFRLVPRSGYAKRLVQAHRLHHATHGRDGAVSFGFLYAPDVRKLKARLRAGGLRARVSEDAGGAAAADA
jgi:beta-carotene 3-hydroxylase